MKEKFVVCLPPPQNSKLSNCAMSAKKCIKKFDAQAESLFISKTYYFLTFLLPSMWDCINCLLPEMQSMVVIFIYIYNLYIWYTLQHQLNICSHILSTFTKHMLSMLLKKENWFKCRDIFWVTTINSYILITFRFVWVVILPGKIWFWSLMRNKKLVKNTFCFAGKDFCIASAKPKCKCCSHYTSFKVKTNITIN